MPEQGIQPESVLQPLSHTYRLFVHGQTRLCSIDLDIIRPVSFPSRRISQENVFFMPVTNMALNLQCYASESSKSMYVMHNFLVLIENHIDSKNQFTFSSNGWGHLTFGNLTDPVRVHQRYDSLRNPKLLVNHVVIQQMKSPQLDRGLCRIKQSYLKL